MGLPLISNDTTLDTGETALLVCVGYGLPSVSITWSINGETVSNTSLITIYEEEFIHSDGRVFKQSFLQLCSVERFNAGSYTCTASNGQRTASAETVLTVAGVSG